MIKLILELLKSNDFYEVSKTVDIAKGRYELTSNLKKIYKQEQRKYIEKWRKNELSN